MNSFFDFFTHSRELTQAPLPPDLDFMTASGVAQVHSLSDGGGTSRLVQIQVVGERGPSEQSALSLNSIPPLRLDVQIVIDMIPRDSQH